nr:hypothetical protein [Escherichia coli O25b:H4-ST131]
MYCFGFIMVCLGCFGFIWVTKMSLCFSFTAPDLARQERYCGQCPRPAGHRTGALPLWLSVTVYASLSPFTDECPSAAFAAYPRQKDDRLRIPRSA